MGADRIRIGVVAPSSRIAPALAEAVEALAVRLYPLIPPSIEFHPQCYASAGHFAGSDAQRADAFVEVANDPRYDALWFARGGYGSGRLAAAILPRLEPAARAKTYLGYSDAGYLLGALYSQGFGRVAHGPMAQDLIREGGEAAVARALAWMVDGDGSAVEPTALAGPPAAAFNMATLSSLVGAPWQPDLAGHALMLEEVSEPMYRIDRFLMHLTSNPAIRQVAGIRLGRCSLIPPNDPEFAGTEADLAEEWCARSGVAYLGRADIGHDVDNRVVPFGSAWREI